MVLTWLLGVYVCVCMAVVELATRVDVPLAGLGDGLGMIRRLDTRKRTMKHCFDKKKTFRYRIKVDDRTSRRGWYNSLGLLYVWQLSKLFLIATSSLAD